jgi:signal transduction histidine kinase/CheY-like chemotaxis protein
VLGTVAIGLWAIRVRRRLTRESKQLAVRLAEAETKAAAAENANTVKSEFLATISHEMRTPMSGILRFAEMAMKTELTPLQREYLDRVLVSAEWLTHVLSDVLDFSRLEACRLELELREFSLSSCVASAVKMVEDAAIRKNLDVTCQFHPAIPPLMIGDGPRIRQTIVNLLDNAVRFTTSGSVVLSAGVVSETEETITVFIAVADTGIGISPERQSQIFEPFNGSPRSNGDRTGGTGLGLSICRRLTEMMGGTLEVQSHLGAGSTFRFTARLQKAVTAMECSPEDAILSRLTPHRLSILIAEENVLQRRLTTKLLESAGHQISPASTGAQASEIFCSDLFDLVLMSTQLPDLDGLHLASSLRELEDDTTRTHIYALRSESDPVSESQYKAAGVDGCIQKPAPVEELMRIAGEVGMARISVHR